jgi:hypothetical protein
LKIKRCLLPDEQRGYTLYGQKKTHTGIPGCQGALKMHHPGALENVPPLTHNISKFSWILPGESEYGQQVKDGTARSYIQPVRKGLV